MPHEDQHSEILLRNGARHAYLVEVILGQGMALTDVESSEESVQGHVTMEAEA